MSLRVMVAVLDHLESGELDPATRLLLLLLADHTNEEKGAAWPSVATLARRVGLHPRKVQERLYRMRELGVLEVTERPGRSSLYRMRLEALAPGLDLDGTHAATGTHPRRYRHPTHAATGTRSC